MFVSIVLPQKSTELHQKDHNFFHQNTEYNVYRDDLEDIHNKKGFEVLVTFLSCQIVIGF